MMYCTIDAKLNLVSPGTSVHFCLAVLVQVGFLYLSNTTRLHELMLALGFTCNSADLIVPASLYAKEKGATPPSSKAS